MTEVKEKFTPIDDSISVFIRQQKEYDEYLKKLRDEAQKGSPREKLKKGGKVAARGSLMDRPLYTANPHQKNINAARHILYARRSLKDGGSTNIDERIKELEYTIKIILPAIRDQEGADLYERAKEELELLKDRKKSF
jgi:hypothetical protein